MKSTTYNDLDAETEIFYVKIKQKHMEYTRMITHTLIHSNNKNTRPASQNKKAVDPP